MKEKSTEPGAVWKKSRQWYWLPTAVFSVGIFSIILLLWVNHISERQHVDSLRVDAIMGIQINVASAHLRLEEAVSGDATADVKEIMKYIDEAIKLNDSTLNGGESEHGRITEPLHDPNLRAQNKSIRQNLVKFKTIALERLQNPEKSGIGSVADQQFDAVFSGILGDAGEIDDLIGKSKTRNWEKSRQLFMGLLIILISMITAATAGIWGYEKRQKSSEEALRKSHALLNEMGRLANVGGWDLDMATQELVWTEEVYRIHEVDLTFKPTVSKAIGFYAPTYRPIIERAVQRAIEHGEQFDLEMEIVTAKGRQRWVHAIGNVGREQGKITGTFQDITERKLAEVELRDAETRYRVLFDQSPNGILLIDIETKKTMEANETAHKQLGYTHEEFVALRISDYEALEKPEEIAKHMQMIIRKGSDDFETQHRTKNGEIRDVHVFSKPVHLGVRDFFYVIFQDITERKQGEKSIEKLRRRYESILGAAGEGIMGLDTEGMQTFVNPAATRMLGYSEDELIGKRSHELWHHTKPDGSPHPSEECPIYAAFRDGAVHHEPEDVFWRKDGSSFPVEYTSTPIIEQGNLVGAVVAFSDITKTIALRDKLEKLSITDALTGFYNRRGFLALGKPKLKLSLRKMEKILLIYADMDNLKAINDNSGHQEGDKALAEIANILKSTFRESDILARHGGDEFAILAIDTCDEKVIQERIQKNIDSYNKKVNPVHKLSLSIGVVCHDPENPCTLDDLLIKADALMYENKSSKKG